MTLGGTDLESDFFFFFQLSWHSVSISPGSWLFYPALNDFSWILSSWLSFSQFTVTAFPLRYVPGFFAGAVSFGVCFLETRF